MNDGTRDGRSGIRDAECSRIALKHLWCKASVATSTREREIREAGGRPVPCRCGPGHQMRTTSDKRDKTQRA